MRFGQDDGTFDNAEQRVGQLAGGSGLFSGALSRDGLKVFRKVVRYRLEHAGNRLLHPSIRIRKLQGEGTKQAAGAPKVRRAFFQMLQKGEGLFHRVRNSEVRA